ncbi:MAG: hypothetical protein AB2L14_17580 [Candidatus Xenobiia bacterium LiM19]
MGKVSSVQCGFFKSIRYAAILLALSFFMAMAASQTSADMPARNFYAVQFSGFKKEIQVFASADVKAFIRKIPSMKDKKGYPFDDLDKSFTAVQEYDFINAVIELIKPSLKKGDNKKAERFLKSIGDRKLVRGKLQARNGGPFITSFTLSADSPGKYSFTVINTIDTPGSISPRYTHQISL